MSDLSLAQHIASSNIPVEQKKTAIRRFFERATGVVTAPVYNQAMGHVSEVGAVLREGGESLAIGAGLGYLHAEKGLDIEIGNNKVPIDGVVAALGFLGAIALANHPLGIAPDLRHAGSLSLGILAFRKTHDWREEKKVSSTTTKTTTAVHGEGSIESLAAEFGL